MDSMLDKGLSKKIAAIKLKIGLIGIFYFSLTASKAGKYATTQLSSKPIHKNLGKVIGNLLGIGYDNNVSWHVKVLEHDTWRLYNKVYIVTQESSCLCDMPLTIWTDLKAP